MGPTETRWGFAGAAALAVAAVLAGCGGGPGAGVPRKFTDEQLKARFPWDLGPDEIAEVGTYPAPMQQAYQVFQATCTKCHTLARPINAPIASKAQWSRFAHRMHAKSGNTLLDKKTFEQITDFLAYDAGVRKIGQRARYLAQLKKLNTQYAELQVERARVQLEEGERLARTEMPPSGSR